MFRLSSEVIPWSTPFLLNSMMKDYKEFSTAFLPYFLGLLGTIITLIVMLVPKVAESKLANTYLQIGGSTLTAGVALGQASGKNERQ